jgi:hypothetical protein
MKEECNTVWVFLATSNISRVIHVVNLALSVVYSLNDPCASNYCSITIVQRLWVPHSQ